MSRPGRGLARETVAIGLGSNLGDRRAQLEGALRALRASPLLAVRAVSSFHETAPVGGPPGQPDFLNAALVGEALAGPFEILELLQALERRAGRDRRRTLRNGPRTLDLDLLVQGARCFSSARLELPHPRMLERSFVLEPLAEIAPELLIPPGGRSVREALGELRARSLGAALR